MHGQIGRNMISSRAPEPRFVIVPRTISQLREKIGGRRAKGCVSEAFASADHCPDFCERVQGRQRCVAVPALEKQPVHLLLVYTARAVGTTCSSQKRSPHSVARIPLRQTPRIPRLRLEPKHEQQTARTPKRNRGISVQSLLVVSVLIMAAAPSTIMTQRYTPKTVRPRACAAMACRAS